MEIGSRELRRGKTVRGDRTGEEREEFVETACTPGGQCHHALLLGMQCRGGGARHQISAVSLHARLRRQEPGMGNGYRPQPAPFLQPRHLFRAADSQHERIPLGHTQQAVGMGEAPAPGLPHRRGGCQQDILLRNLRGRVWQPAPGSVLCRLPCRSRSHGRWRTIEKCPYGERGQHSILIAHRSAR